MKAPQRPLILGLTGQIGSGKSQASEIFEELGASIMDADVFARELTAVGSPALSSIAQTFGPQFIDAQGELKRRELGELVFRTPSQRAALESILHPLIRKRFLLRLEALLGQTPPPALIVYVVPLLFESNNSYPEIDKVLVISSTRSACLQRIQKRDKVSAEFALKKYEAQLPIEEKAKRADFVIKNEGSLHELRCRIESLYHSLLPNH